jgi:hypothetical protein
VTLGDRIEDAYEWFAGLSLSVRIWLVTLAGGLAAAAVTGGVPIALFLAGGLTGLIARLMYG